MAMHIYRIGTFHFSPNALLYITFFLFFFPETFVQYTLVLEEHVFVAVAMC